MNDIRVACGTRNPVSERWRFAENGEVRRGLRGVAKADGGGERDDEEEEEEGRQEAKR